MFIVNHEFLLKVAKYPVLIILNQNRLKYN